ncbi:MAG: hypothetical protein V4506_12065 [Bacteroidota bacterium]
MIYLTYNDPPSGIYNSQVIDVVNYLNQLSQKKVRLVALISLRKFFANKQKITARCPNAIVIPMFPKAAFWKLNIYSIAIILLFNRSKTIMARGPFATNLAIRLKKYHLCKKVIFDARGAYEAELNEYDIVKDSTVKLQIKETEEFAIHKSDFKLAVSNALVNYWQENYNYTKTNHVIIPCTLSNDFYFSFPSEEQLSHKRKAMGYGADDIIFVYSGSSAGWQSFSLIDEMMCEYLKHPDAKLLVLSNHFDSSFKVMQLFKEKVSVTFVEPEKVKDYLWIADYGILFREQSMTNKVASPVKFAEYLSCGLKVLISKNLGDYSDFSTFEDLHFDKDAIAKVLYSEKLRIHALGNACFKKEKFKEQYTTLLNQ